MEKLVFIVHIVVCFSLIGLILIQQGKGAEVGASFGSGASQTLFGSQGAANFITRMTALVTVAFFTTCLTMGYFVVQHQKANSIDRILPYIEKATQTPEKASQKPSQPSNEFPEIPNL